jgi:DNA-binding transcriptional LysR family regulator
MELRYLKYFVVVAEELNFTRAAERVHIAQPSLWAQIRKLELEIGVNLLARAGRGIKLTDAGRVFLEQARRTLADAERGVALARQAANGEIGQLSIGHNVPAGFRVFPQTIPSFKRAWPRVQLTFHSLNVPQQLEGLRREEIDVGFVWLPVPDEEFDVCPLVEEPMVAVLAADHRLVSKAAVTVKDLSREPMILPARPGASNSYHEIEQLFAHAGAVLNVAYELDNSVAMINFVAMGCGCSLLPDYVRNIRQEGIVYKPLRAPNMTNTLAIIKRKSAGRVADSFFQFAAERFTTKRAR